MAGTRDNLPSDISEAPAVIAGGVHEARATSGEGLTAELRESSRVEHDRRSQSGM